MKIKGLMKKVGGRMHSLRTQLIVSYVIIGLMVLIIDLTASYVNIMDLSKKRNEKFLFQQFSQSDYNISNVVDEVDSLSKLYINNGDVQSFLEENYFNSAFTEDENYNSIISRMDDFISNYSFINSIYLFTENKKAIGSSKVNTYIVRGDQQLPFFSSALYRSAKESFPKIILGGGIQEKEYNTLSKNGDRYIVSVARAVKPVREPQKSAVLVFNIQENYLTSIYQRNFGSTGKMYIIDNNGNVVSNINDLDMGKKSSAFSRIDHSLHDGSFMMHDGDKSTQVIYYRLKYCGWYLVDELPLADVFTDISNIHTIFITVFFLSFLLLVLISYPWMRKITKPVEYLSEKLSDVGRGNLGVTLDRIPKNEIGILINRFNEMSLNIEELVKRNEKMQEEKCNLELEALQAQINPHFLYNTLNMIKWMAVMSNAGNVEKSLISLGKLLEPIFQDTNRMWSLRNELAYLKNYLDIMNLRYGNKLTYEFSVPWDICEFIIPKFTLQPIMENSVSHGLRQCSKIHIDVQAFRGDGQFNIVISDDGSGIDPARVSWLNGSFQKEDGGARKERSEGVGLYNVNRRIRLNFGKQYGLRIESSPGKGTKVIIHMPIYFNENR